MNKTLGEIKLPPGMSKTDASDVLERMAATFRERNAQYGDNWRVVDKVMAELHPEGVRLCGSRPEHAGWIQNGEDGYNDFAMWHLWELLIVKLTRFAASDLTHRDSIHDLAVYAAMLESILIEREDNNG